MVQSITRSVHVWKWEKFVIVSKRKHKALVRYVHILAFCAADYNRAPAQKLLQFSANYHKSPARQSTKLVQINPRKGFE